MIVISGKNNNIILTIWQWRERPRRALPLLSLCSNVVSPSNINGNGGNGRDGRCHSFYSATTSSPLLLSMAMAMAGTADKTGAAPPFTLLQRRPNFYYQWQCRERPRRALPLLLLCSNVVSPYIINGNGNGGNGGEGRYAIVCSLFFDA